MNKRSLAVVLPLAGLAACGMFSSSSSGAEGLGKVDTLVGWVERVHTESELSKERVRTAVDSLHALVTAKFEGEVVLAYREFREAIDRSKKQADKLRSTVSNMKRSADPVFMQWSNDLHEFSSVEMRQRSRERLSDARRRYEAVVDAAEPALAIYEEVNRTLHDYALFLNHDLNPSSVAGIGDDVRTLRSLATQLDSQFNDCLEASRRYVESAGLSTPPAAPGGAAPVEGRSQFDGMDLPPLPERNRQDR